MRRPTRHRWRFAAAFMVLAAGACLPPDNSKERGAIYVHLSAAPLIQDRLGGYRIDFERVAMIVSGDVIQCHSMFYVERPKSAVAVLDLMRPFTFEHRSLLDDSCGTVGGFVNLANAVPFIAEGITEDERKLLMPDGIGVVGSMHVVARIRSAFESPGAVPFERKVDVVIHNVTGFSMIAAGVAVPSAGKSDVAFGFSLTPLATELTNVTAWDRSRDGTITTEELPPYIMARIRIALADKWSLLSRSTTGDAGAD